MGNPVIAEVLRGDRVELTHRGAGAVVDATGAIVMAFGDIERPVYPRSASRRCRPCRCSRAAPQTASA